MKNFGDFCPNCPKVRQMTRFVKVYVDLGGVLSPRQEMISVCTRCRWMVRRRQVYRGVYRTIEARRLK